MSNTDAIKQIVNAVTPESDTVIGTEATGANLSTVTTRINFVNSTTYGNSRRKPLSRYIPITIGLSASDGAIVFGTTQNV